MTICRNVPQLDPDSSKWYHLQWPSSELGDGVTIDTSDWTMPAGLVEDASTATGLITSVRLSVATGTATGSYDVINTKKRGP